jgi:hypothetical protein
MLRNHQFLNCIFKRQFSITSPLSMKRKPPKEEFENNITHTRKKTAEPFDRLFQFKK